MVTPSTSSMNKSDPDRGLSREDRECRIAELRDLVCEKASDLELTSWLTETVFVKYLRARQWNVKKANIMLQNSLEWRNKNRPESIGWKEVEDDCRCGKMYRTKISDRERRPCILMRPANEEHYGEHDRNIKFLIYILEGTVRSMPDDGDGKMNIIIDFKGWTLRNSPPLRTTKETASILQNQYPERLCRAYLYNPPSIFSIFWTMVRPFLDPVTAAKVKCIYSNNPKSMELLEENFDLDELEVGVGGRSNESYDHNEYGIRMLNEDAMNPYIAAKKESEKPTEAQQSKEEGVGECDSNRSSVDDNNENGDMYGRGSGVRHGNGYHEHIDRRAHSVKMTTKQWNFMDDNFSKIFLGLTVLSSVLLLYFQRYVL